MSMANKGQHVAGLAGWERAASGSEAFPGGRMPKVEEGQSEGEMWGIGGG